MGLSLQFSAISENIVSQSLKTFQCKTFWAHGKVIVQIYRPCVNINVFTGFSKDFNQAACWLVFALLVVIFLYSCFYCIRLVMRTAVNYQHSSKCSGSAVSFYSPPALSREGGCWWPNRWQPSSRPAPHLLPSSTAPGKPAAPNLEGTAPAPALILDILGKGTAKGGKGLFQVGGRVISAGIYCSMGSLICFICSDSALKINSNATRILGIFLYRFTNLKK